MKLPAGPPFTLRAQLLTPLGGGGHQFESDARITVDRQGRLASVERWPGEPLAGMEPAASSEPALDIRPLTVMPGMVDLHVHLPQTPSAGLGYGLDLLTWLGRYVFPREQAFDVATARSLAPQVFRAMARAGTTTAVVYGAIWAPSLDAAFEAAERHGIRAVIGKVMMDELTYDDGLPRERILETSLRQSAELCEKWDGRDAGRLRYAFTPRFALSCSAEMLRESAALAQSFGAYWQTPISEDKAEVAQVRQRFPEARDYLDVYDRAGALGERTILAHAIHLSDGEIARLIESGSRIAHCPASNLFLASGVMPLARYLAEGAVVGLGSDVAGGPDLSMLGQARLGAYAQNALRAAGGGSAELVDALGWLRLATLGGADALGLASVLGSVEVGKEADLIAVDGSLAVPPGGSEVDDPLELAGRLIFRSHPEMVVGAWVRGRLLPA
ncbi:MAG: amidohydrolase family protein [Chloroflexi bacterium]|nr:amidohydrolase family protein [Chloroflexota bacterium]